LSRRLGTNLYLKLELFQKTAEQHLPLRGNMMFLIGFDRLPNPMYSRVKRVSFLVAAAGCRAYTGQPELINEHTRRYEMRGSFKDIPVAFEMPEGKLRFVEWGDMTVELGDVTARVDPEPLFKGLPDDRCQCPHWGYVIKGTLRYRFADHEELFNAGDVYYAPPGHTPVLEAGAVYVEFSPTSLLKRTMEVVERNMAAMQGRP
jgi:hypothetical protein